MNTYRVQSGTLDVHVEAKNQKMAVIKAIDENNPTALGVLVSCLKEGDSDDEQVYMKTESVLNDMGFEVIKK
jgi:hypothetical protein